MADADRNRGGCFLDLTASRGEHFRIERFLVLFGFCAWKHAAAKTLISCSHFPDESQHVNRTVQVLGWMNQHQTLGHMFGYSALASQRRGRAEPDQEFSCEGYGLDSSNDRRIPPRTQPQAPTHKSSYIATHIVLES